MIEIDKGLDKILIGPLPNGAGGNTASYEAVHIGGRKKKTTMKRKGGRVKTIKKCNHVYTGKKMKTCVKCEYRKIFRKKSRTQRSK